MKDEREGMVCGVCGKTQKCVEVNFYPKPGKEPVSLRSYMGAAAGMVPGEFTLAICEECAEKKGASPKGMWIAVIICHILAISGFVVMGSMEVINALVGCGIVAYTGSWITGLALGITMMQKCRYACKKYVGACIAQMIPVLGLIVLLRHKKKIDLGYKACSALKDKAMEHVSQRQAEDKAREERVQQGCLTQEDKQVIEAEERQKAEQEYVRQEQQEKEKKGTMVRSALWIVVTLCLGIYGASLYSSGKGYMEFFGIELSSGAFALIIGLFIVWDIISIVRVSKKE